ncbi:MAG TPA: hypothetical protein VMF69_07910, partial [Gemmataceae bacterium]|nr:hypothetical protein [Gemmataceae bacterium]
FVLSGDGSVLQVGTNAVAVERLDVKTGRRLAALGTPTFMWGLDVRVGMAFSRKDRRYAIVEQEGLKLCVTIGDVEGKNASSSFPEAASSSRRTAPALPLSATKARCTSLPSRTGSSSRKSRPESAT